MLLHLCYYQPKDPRTKIQTETHLKLPAIDSAFQYYSVTLTFSHQASYNSGV